MNNSREGKEFKISFRANQGICKYTAILTILVFSSFLWACAPTRSNYEGAAVGGVVGTTAGALLDKKNPWRGAIVGGALGAVAGGSFAEISKRAASEARTYGRPVAYQRQTSNGWQKVEAVPQSGYGSNSRCVVVKTYENGHLVDEKLSCD